MNELILVIDDEPRIVKLARDYLEAAGFRVLSAADGPGGLAAARHARPDQVVLDLMLPGMDGLELCRILRSEPATKRLPIIMLTARAEETDKIVGLEMGADDYLTKPFSARELTARVRAVLRRAGETTAGPGRRTQVGADLVIDRDRREVTLNGVKLDLTPAEFGILEALAASVGRVLSRDRLLDLLWGDGKIVTDRTIDVHIRNLRRKLGRRGDLIRNVRGAGYKLEP